MSNQVVTIGYLKEFVSGKLTVNTNNPDTYCPTYAELTGGSLVKNYSAGANPKDTVNGIDIPNCTVNIGYENNQLVIRQDLLLKYMVLDSIAITADSTSISQCGGQTNVCVKGTFHLETKSEGGSIEKGGSETDSTIQATWSGDADNSGPSTCTVISFDENTVGGYGTSNPTTAPSRNESTTATYTYKGTNLTSVNDTTKTSNTVTITQAANNVHDWYYEGKTDYATSLVASCPGNVSENGGTATVTSTLYYEQDWRCDDDCGNTVGYKYVSASKSGPSTSVTFAEQDCDEPERCETVSLSMSGQSTSCSVCQDESSVPCYCGENCAGNCNTTIHWHCAEKQSYTNMGTTYTINGLDGDGCLPCSGGTATVIIHGTTDTELYTRAAECRTATLSTTMGKTADQTVVGLVQSHTGETGSGTYYDYLYGRSYTVPTNKYTAYTQYHYMAYNTAGKHNRNETTYQYDTLGTSYKYEVLEYSFNDYYISSKKFYSKSDFVDEGNSAATWDAAMEKYNNSATCSGGTGDDCSGGTWVYDEDLNPNETGITGNYKVWFTNYTNFSKMNDEMMDRVPNVCYVASISPNKTMFYSASTSNNSMVKTFEFAANTTTAETSGSVTFTSDNPSVGNSPNKIEKITVHYKVAACTNNTDKYTISSVTAPSTAVACSAVPGNGVNITVSGAHSIVKVSQADPKVSGETTASAYTMTQGTDYTMNYTPTGSNTGIEDRTVTVTITGIGKFSGQTKTVTYTQKADTACTTATTCTPSTSYTYSNYSVSYNGGAVACNAEPSKSKIIVTADKTTTTKDVFCQESSTTDNGVSITDFSVSYSPSGNNTGTSSRTVTGTVTHNGSTAGTFTFTQNSGSTCQATVTSTTYTYRIDAADFDACDSETTVTVYATPTYYYSDGSNVEGEETEISVFPLPTITYRLGTGETTVTASQNSTSSSRIWTVIASFRHNNSNQTASDTATQSAGPCNTGSTVYQYSFKNCYSDRQLGLFASNATPSGSHLQFAMLSALDGTAVTVLVTSNNGTLVNGSTSNSSSSAKIGDSVKVYSVTNTTNVWTLEGTITLTAEDRSFEYGNCTSCTCKVTSIKAEPSAHTFTSEEDYEFTITIVDDNCSSCTDQFDVYENNIWVKGGSGTISLPNKTTSYVVKASDDTSKQCTINTTKYSSEEETCYGLYVVCDRTKNTFKYEFTPLTQTDLTLKVTFYNNGAEIGTYTNTLIPQGMGETGWLTLDFDVSYCDDFSVTQLTENSRGDDYSLLCDGQSTCVFDDSESDSTCVIGETIISTGGNGTKVTVSKGGTKTLTIYTKEDGMFSMVSVEPDTYDSGLVSIQNTASSRTDYHTTWVLTASNSKTGSTDITFKNGCGEYVVPFEVTAATPTTYSCKVNYVNNTSETSKTAIVNLITTGLTAGQSKTLTLVGASGSVNVTDTKAITWCIDSITNINGSTSFSHTTSNGVSCFSLTTNGNEITITISDSTPPPTPCSCSVTNISVSPSAHTFTSSGSAYFTVTIVDNECSGCTDQFLVYKSDGTHVTSGIGTFSLSNQTGTFTIKAKDNQNKTCTLTTTKYTAPVYVFKFNNPTGGFDSTSTETHIIHKPIYEGGGPTTILTSTKDGSNVGYTMSSNVSWITTSTAVTTCSWTISKNTSTSSRSGTITLTQSGSNKTLIISVTQGGAPATCDCSTVSISCNPTNSYTTGNSVSTVVTVNAGSNCSTKWKAYSSSGSYLGEGESGGSLSRTITGTVTFRSEACTGKTTTWTISKPECAKPIIRLSGSGDAYVLQNYSEIDEWCGTSPNVSVSTSADYIGDGSDYTHYSPTTCSFEIANCAASITSINLDSGGWILDSYSGLNSFGISFTIRPDAIMNATCRLRGSFTYLMQGTPFSGTFSISIQFNG